MKRHKSVEPPQISNESAPNETIKKWNHTKIKCETVKTWNLQNYQSVNRHWTDQNRQSPKNAQRWNRQIAKPSENETVKTRNHPMMSESVTEWNGRGSKPQLTVPSWKRPIAKPSESESTKSATVTACDGQEWNGQMASRCETVKTWDNRRTKQTKSETVKKRNDQRVKPSMSGTAQKWNRYSSENRQKCETGKKLKLSKSETVTDWNGKKFTVNTHNNVNPHEMKPPTLRWNRKQMVCIGVKRRSVAPSKYY